MTSSSVADRIDELLPQTQCRKCGYAGCRPYAEAVAAGHADIYQCPPGGAEVAREMAELTGVEFKLGDARLGVSGQATVAFIDEQLCIGCTLCIQACPVDAIVGAAKLRHTVVGRDCTGCELCIPVCPVDCILLEPVHSADSSLAPPTGWDAWSEDLAQTARTRYAAAQSRRATSADSKRAVKALKAADKLSDLAKHSLISDPAELERKKALIEAAMARARQRKPE